MCGCSDACKSAGPVAVFYYPGAPAPSTVAMRVFLSRALGSNVEVKCCIRRSTTGRHSVPSRIRVPFTPLHACLIWVGMILAGSGRHGGMGGFDAKLQGLCHLAG